MHLFPGRTPMNERLPDVDDMLKAGMSLAEAFQLWGEMMQAQKLGPAYWWGKVTSYSGSSQGPASSLAASLQ